MAISRVDRRQFLRQAIAAAVPAGALAAQPIRPGLPVVVIGAGLAGLRAATVLRGAGRPVRVLEAQTRPGGRVRTIREPFSDGLSAEAGAIRIPGVHRAVLALVRSHKLQLVPFESSAGAVIEPSLRTSTSDSAADALRADEHGTTARGLLERYVGELPADLSLATTAVSENWRRYDQVTWPEWLRGRGASPAAVRLMTQGGDSRRLSALYVLRQFALLRRSRQLFKIAGGMDRLPAAIASTLGDDIRYGATVLRVARRRDRVAIEYRADDRLISEDASHVIVTAPLPALGRITFDPVLSGAKRRACAMVPYHPGVRILLQCRERVWNAAGYNGSARTPRAEIWDCTYDRQAVKRGILGASITGSGRRSAPTSDVALAVDVMQEAFPGVAHVAEVAVVHRWADDPFAGGAFVAFAPTQMTAFLPELARSEGRFHFAGEHTSSWMGWMEGAVESGERAAREVLAS